uniref:NADH-ubiquinone oxidoreductase chain 2 n=1 Tax=Gobiopterus lacustris TaxID=943675 RepID=A0A3G4RXW9_GOBLA|nr:NADH dehydrogenase subunit 2 [Gobiopterus lacustris]AYU71243.1 NADH dehydrogenase subunit 2 [Gobiopterus lacustris]
MSPIVFTLLLLTLILGTMTTLTSTHWLVAWMGLEVNTLAILPLMARPHHPRSTEAATKYFLTQATAAATLLFGSISNAWLSGQWDIQMLTHPVPSTIIILALSLKIGLAPLHTWLPEVLQGLDLSTGLLMSTWQKLAPMALLLQIPTDTPHLLTFLGVMSTLVGGWGGLNQTQLRKILAYSSIAHLGWMILILQFSPSLTALALATYLVMTSSIFLIFKMNNTTTISSLTTSWAKAPLITTTAPLILLSLGGLPPLTGFMPKWLILQELTKQQLPLVATITALSALLSLYFYLRLCYSMALTVAPNNLASTPTWRFPNNYPLLPLTGLSLSALLLLPLTPSFTTLIQL